MKVPFFVILFLLLGVPTFSQKKTIEEIASSVHKGDAEAHLTFLASDEMRGRGTGSPEIAIAASYLATQFKGMGVKMLPGASTYFQEVGLQQNFAPAALDLRLDNTTYTLKSDLVLLKGGPLVKSGQIVFVGFGSTADFNQVDVRGKVVVAYAGSSETTTMREAFLNDAPQKYSRVKEHGGLALIEVVAFREAPWPAIAQRFSTGRITLSADDITVSEIPHLWMLNSATEGLTRLLQQKQSDGTLTVDVRAPKVLSGKNVIGWVEGTDATLKREYVILSAHYDHLGVRKNSSPDSIYNGARDNAIGTTAILEAARFLSRHPVKRSMVIIAFCAEEEGLLGSQWYAGHPMLPLRETVYNLDCDGAGYNDKTLANVIDLNRTTMDDLIRKGCASYGLTLTGDPAPEMGLYERSDNYNFAVKGVPAVDISPGVKGIDDNLMKFYHQPADEAESLDFDYLEKFFRAYVYSAVLIGNSPTRPFWKPGDKFEPAGKKLYGMP